MTWFPALNARVFQKEKSSPFTNRIYFNGRPKDGFQLGVWCNKVDLSELNLGGDVADT